MMTCAHRTHGVRTRAKKKDQVAGSKVKAEDEGDEEHGNESTLAVRCELGAVAAAPLDGEAMKEKMEETQTDCWVD